MSNFSMVSINSNMTGTPSQMLITTLVDPSAASEDSLDKEIVESVHILILSLLKI